MVAVVRDRLAAFLYWAAHWLERAADRLYYGKPRTEWVGTQITIPVIPPGTPITWREEDLA